MSISSKNLFVVHGIDKISNLPYTYPKAFTTSQEKQAIALAKGLGLEVKQLYLTSLS